MIALDGRYEMKYVRYLNSLLSRGNNGMSRFVPSFLLLSNILALVIHQEKYKWDKKEKDQKQHWIFIEIFYKIETIAGVE